MKWKLRIVCAALLATTALPAFALQLGQIQVKSALNQPLVASIPLHPKNLTELDGLTVGLAPATDFQRAGLALTPTDQTLRFHVVADNNAQKLILVTSSQPITDPYLDFLVQVNTREGRQVREFVVLLNPVIAAPAPAVQAAPIASAPATAAAAAQPAQLPPPAQFPQPQVKPQPAPQSQQVKAQPAPPPATVPQPQAAPPATNHLQAGGQINVQRGDTLYHLAQQAVQGTNVSINQMMLALQATNPDAFFKDNIDNLKAGAILRIPTRDQIDQRSVAAAAAEVRRQYVAWQAAKPHAATVVEGAATQAAANAAPQSGNAPEASDHLTLSSPTGQAGGTSNRPGMAGGTGHATVTGLKQQLQADRDALVSLNQSNADLGSRVHSLEDIQTKTSQLLKLKDATIAELQRKLAAVQAGHAGTNGAAQAKPVASAVAQKPVAKPAAHAATPWYMRPVAWVVAAVIVLILIVLGLDGRRRRAARDSALQGPLDGPADVPLSAAEAVEPAPEEAAPAPDSGAEAQPEPDAVSTAAAAGDDPYGFTALRQPATEDATVVAPVVPVLEPAKVAAPVRAERRALKPADDGVSAEPLFSDDPVDTKLDLARAYLDMGDPVGARAMLEEVLGEGSQTQKDEANRLLAEAAG